MKPFNGYEAKKQVAREPLPAGGYVVKVLDVQELTYSWGSVLEISFDVVDGERKGFFAADYKNQTQEDKKWRGKYRLSEPKDDGSEKDKWTKNTFNGAMFAFEDSNEGFRWDWDESKLKGKTVGALFRDKEWEKDNRTGWTTECCKLVPVEDIRQNLFKMPKPKPLAEKPKASAYAAVSGFEEITDDDELPFKL